MALLLHGLVSSGGTFGAAYDVLGQRARVVVLDLLGFGGSMDAAGSCDAPAHIAALDAALEALDLDRHPVVAVGHSMGAGLALRWAAAHPDRVCGVVTLGAPLYRSDAEATERLREMGPMVALLAGGGWVSRTICWLSCRHRYLASWLAVVSQPELPVPVARAVSQHTWTSFSGSLDSLVRDTGWLVALERLAGLGIPVVLAAGDGDPVPVPGRGAELARQFPSTHYETHPDADHLLPLTDPDWCRDLIEQVLTDGMQPASLGGRLSSPDELVADFEPRSQRQQEAATESQLDRKDRADILLQQIIDKVARHSKGRQHEQVVSELATTIAEQDLPGKPRPWLDAVAAAAVDGNAYVVSASTAQVSDVPPPTTDRSGKTIT